MSGANKFSFRRLLHRKMSPVPYRQPDLKPTQLFFSIHIYAKLNWRALEDAELFSKIGRVRTPSPTPYSDTEEEILELCKGDIAEEIKSTRENDYATRDEGLEDAPILPDILIISSESDTEFCKCQKVSSQSEEDDLPVSSSSQTSAETDSDFEPSEADSGTVSNTSGSSSEGLLEEGSQAESSVDLSHKRGLAFQKKKLRTKSTPKRITSEEESGKVVMETAVDKGRKKKSLMKNGKSKPDQRRQTRSNSNVLSATDFNMDMEKGGLSTERRGPRQSLKKSTTSGKAKVKENSISAVVVDVVFGKTKKSVPEVNELRRKRDEDTLKCGRIPRTVGNVSLDQPFSEAEAHTVQHDAGMKEASPRNVTDLPNSSPDISVLGQRNLVTECTELSLKKVSGRDCDVIARNSYVKPRNKSNLQQSLVTDSSSQSILSQRMLDIDVREEREFAVVADYGQPSENPKRYSRAPSPITKYRANNQSEGVGGEREISRSVDRQQLRQDSYDPVSKILGNERPQNTRRHESRSQSRSPHHHGQKKTRREDLDSRRSRSISPGYKNIGRDCRRSNLFEEEKGKRLMHADTHRGGRHQKRQDRNSNRSHSRDSRSGDSSYKFRRSQSPSQSRKHHRGSRRYSVSPSRSSSLPRQGTEMDWKKARELEVCKDTLALPPPSYDRRTRRYKQAVRESEMSKRQMEGRKTFYLTLDPEGKPYGPGKATWLAHINKLSKGLDPSCLHIRKQTHEAVCIFKDRLNEDFEYSGDLNDDHLRALMGKAVTRRRSELISLIQRGGDQPSYVGEQVWKQLEKIAASKQRETRTELARYANSCRVTLGRTGSIGVQGVRERLRERFERSPDPDEVYEEMTRDKGFGKKKEGKLQSANKLKERVSDEEVVKHRLEIASHEFESEPYLSEEGPSERRKDERPRHYEMEEHVGGEHGMDRDIIEVGSKKRNESDYALQTNKLSNVEYIHRLEAELRSLRGENSGGSTCRREERAELLLHARRERQ